jgi:hypothetical protein
MIDKFASVHSPLREPVAVAAAVRQALAARLAPPLVEALRAGPPGTCHIAGGLVRDIFLGRGQLARDADLFFAEAMEPALLAAARLAGRVDRGPFGAWRWWPAAGGAHADLIVIERFDNGLARCAVIGDCLAQFDATVNAVAVDCANGHWHADPRAVADLRAGVVRRVRNDFPDGPIGPQTTLTRLAVLWHRLDRLATRLSFGCDREARAWLDANRALAAAAPEFNRVFGDD